MNWQDKLYDFNALKQPEDARKGLVFDVQRFAIHDGGGIRTNVFLKGCSLNCQWCQNPESIRKQPEVSFIPSYCIQCRKCIEVCPVNAIKCDGEQGRVVGIDYDVCTRCGECFKSCYAGAMNYVGRWVSVDDVVKMVERDKEFYQASGGGVTFSGGEPTMQPEFLLEALKAIKHMGLHTALETCLHVPWFVLQTLLPYVDLVLADIKHIDPAEHARYTGFSNELILENFRQLHRENVAVRARFPMIPGVNDHQETVQEIISFLEPLTNIQGLDVLPYNRLGQSKCLQLGRVYPLADLLPPEHTTVEAVADRFRKVFADVTVGGS